MQNDEGFTGSEFPQSERPRFDAQAEMQKTVAESQKDAPSLREQRITFAAALGANAVAILLGYALMFMGTAISHAVFAVLTFIGGIVLMIIGRKAQTAQKRYRPLYYVSLACTALTITFSLSATAIALGQKMDFISFLIPAGMLMLAAGLAYLCGSVPWLKTLSNVLFLLLSLVGVVIAIGLCVMENYALGISLLFAMLASLFLFTAYVLAGLKKEDYFLVLCANQLIVAAVAIMIALAAISNDCDLDCDCGDNKKTSKKRAKRSSASAKTASRGDSVRLGAALGMVDEINLDGAQDQAAPIDQTVGQPQNMPQRPYDVPQQGMPQRPYDVPQQGMPQHPRNTSGRIDPFYNDGKIDPFE